ncbi:hypothetical protein, partial [Cupriavidus sp. SHE]|uniref:hypothetical protein n=1 Tax=Cupriavidus sp. SHE TaxID=1539143 RepID=UPI001E5CB853
DHLRYNLLTAQYHLPSLITFAETADHLHRNPHTQQECGKPKPVDAGTHVEISFEANGNSVWPLSALVRASVCRRSNATRLR